MIQGRENPQDTKLKARLETVRHRIAVMSGKGGVGKSSISVNLATALAAANQRVGLIDTDIHGPNLPLMLGLDNERFESAGEDQQEIIPIALGGYLKVASVANIGYDPGTALIWRGPMKLGLIKQFLADIIWGELDYLVIDTPPGTGDEALTIAQYIKPMTGIVIVTTPQEVALLDSRKSVDFARKSGIPVIGIIENMADGENFKIFGYGGGERAAEELDVPFLGRVALDPRMVAAGDAGTPFLELHRDSEAGGQLQAIVNRIQQYCEVSGA